MPLSVFFVISSWLTAGCCSDTVTLKSSTSPPLFRAQILLLLSRRQRKVLTSLPYCSFLHVWCPPTPLLDYCNTLWTCLDVITMCNLQLGRNLMEQWPDRWESACRTSIHSLEGFWGNTALFVTWIRFCFCSFIFVQRCYGLVYVT